jgi:hypothetical protein
MHRHGSVTMTRDDPAPDQFAFFIGDDEGPSCALELRMPRGRRPTRETPPISPCGGGAEGYWMERTCSRAQQALGVMMGTEDNKAL